MVNRNRIFGSMKGRYGSDMILNTSEYPDYSRDASEITYSPSAIFFPKNETDLIAVVIQCRNNNIPIVFRGAGTGYTGGAVPVENSLVISMEKITHLEIDIFRKLAFSGPGVITKTIMDESKKHSLFYPPDPASYAESTIGGNIAENAGGLHCKKYGVTRDYVIGLRAVTIEGEVLRTGIYNDNSDLFDLGALLIGSEGLLAGVTEIALRLIDLPKFGPTILAAFDDPEDAARSVAEITGDGIVPSVMEYMDEDAIQCSLEYESGIALKTAAALLLMETAGANFGGDAAHIKAICDKNKASLVLEETDPQKSECLWSIRRNLSKAVKASAKYKIAEDVAVPPSRLPELVGMVAEMNTHCPMRVNSYGHAGDGNLHVNFLTDDDNLVKNGVIEEAINRLFKTTLDFGGTITGEHGIGLTKKKFLPWEFDRPTLSRMREIKMIFDRTGLLNPGKMFE